MWEMQYSIPYDEKIDPTGSEPLMIPALANLRSRKKRWQARDLRRRSLGTFMPTPRGGGQNQNSHERGDRLSWVQETLCGDARDETDEDAMIRCRAWAERYAVVSVWWERSLSQSGANDGAAEPFDESWLGVPVVDVGLLTTTTTTTSTTTSTTSSLSCNDTSGANGTNCTSLLSAGAVSTTANSATTTQTAPPVEPIGSFWSNQNRFATMRLNFLEKTGYLSGSTSLTGVRGAFAEQQLLRRARATPETDNMCLKTSDPESALYQGDLRTFDPDRDSEGTAAQVFAQAQFEYEEMTNILVVKNARGQTVSTFCHDKEKIVHLAERRCNICVLRSMDY